MSDIVYICEKPSQARDIARILGANKPQEGFIKGDGIVITWCLGHLLKLAPPETYCKNLKPWRMDVLPVIPQKWRVLPVLKTKKQFKVIKELLEKTDHAVIATDADREGDVIGREILELCKFKGKVERLWLSALDDASIKKALNDIKPGTATENLYCAGLGRQRADWLIGMNLTMAATCLFGCYETGVLSVGRVQTPTLKLIVDRDHEIENFNPKNYFELLAEFSDKDKQNFWAKWQTPDDLADEAGRCLKSAIIESVSEKIKAQKGVIKDFSAKQKQTKPPLCFSLSNLQKIASSKFGLSAKRTLEVAQALYEKYKATTYPRSDCGFLPESQLQEAKDVLAALTTVDKELKPLVDNCDLSYRSMVWNDKKITAHHAIIPTMNKNVSLSAMSEIERNIYDLIRRYYIAQFLADYEYMQRSVTVECEKEVFKASSNTPLIQGWKKALNKEQLDEDPEDLGNSAIPELTKGAKVNCNDTKLEAKQTKPPARFTEGTLIFAMKAIAKYVDDPEFKKVLKDTSGIGTEATRANILETLIMRKYLERKGKQLISTKKGRELISLLPALVKNPATTARWEQTLEEIAAGKAELDSFLYDQVDVLESMLEQLKQQKADFKGSLGDDRQTLPCSRCGKDMYRRKGKNGFFWGCSGYPECKSTLPDKSEKSCKNKAQ